jgi:hypothetical protein
LPETATEQESNVGIGLNFNFHSNTHQKVHEAPAKGWAPPSTSPHSPHYQKDMQGYAQALEKNFKDDLAGLHQHFSGLDRASQKAVLEYSPNLRDFLGVSDPHAWRKLGKPEGERVHYTAAPAALANAATLMTSERRINRAFDGLKEVFTQHPLGGRRNVNAEYKASSEQAFVNLLNNLGGFTRTTHKLDAVNLILQNAQHLDATARANIAAAAKQAATDPTLPSGLEDKLKQLMLPSGDRNAGRNRFNAKFGIPEQVPPQSQGQAAAVAPDQLVSGLREAGWKDHDLAQMKQHISDYAAAMMRGDAAFAARVAHSYEQLYTDPKLPRLTPENVPFFQDLAREIDASGGMAGTPPPPPADFGKQMVQGLRAANWQNHDLEGVKQQMAAYVHAMKSGDMAAAHAVAQSYNMTHPQLGLPPLTPDNLTLIETSVMALQADLNSRKHPIQLAQELAHSNMPVADLQRFKGAIDKAMHALDSGRPQLCGPAIQEYNNTWGAILGEMDLPMTLQAKQSFEMLSATLGQYLQGGGEPPPAAPAPQPASTAPGATPSRASMPDNQAPLYTMDAEALVAKLADEPYQYGDAKLLHLANVLGYVMTELKEGKEAREAYHAEFSQDLGGDLDALLADLKKADHIAEELQETGNTITEQDKQFRDGVLDKVENMTRLKNAINELLEAKHGKPGGTAPKAPEADLSQAAFPDFNGLDGAGPGARIPIPPRAKAEDMLDMLGRSGFDDAKLEALGQDLYKFIKKNTTGEKGFDEKWGNVFACSIDECGNNEKVSWGRLQIALQKRFGIE